MGSFISRMSQEQKPLVYEEMLPPETAPEVKPRFQCYTCSGTFSNQYNLKRHIQGIHGIDQAGIGRPPVRNLQVQCEKRINRQLFPDKEDERVLISVTRLYQYKNGDVEQITSNC